MDNSPSVPSNGGSAVRFDAYAATVPAEVVDVLDALEGVADRGRWESMERVPLGYAFGSRLVDADGQVGVVWWGGHHAHPHASFQGDASPAAAAVLRECFPGHRVTRCDPIIVETAEAGGYDRLQAACLGIATRHRVKVGTAGDHLVTFDGRTLYLGGTQSAVRLRLYDKRAELLAKLRDPARLAAVPAQLARCEAQIRPATPEAKAAAASAPPEALLGSARWLRELAHDLAGLEVEPFTIRASWRESDHARAWWAMLRQYKAVLHAAARDAGGWDCVGLQIGHDLARLEELEGGTPQA